jgi:hypothetical protein
MQTEQITAAYELFVESHAGYTSQSPDIVRSVITLSQFEDDLRRLHQQYMTGEISFGRSTELIGVPHAELWDILDMMGLPLHN